MARNHGRVTTSIWADDDFRRLSAGQQRLYMFLISQPNLNHAGLIPMTLRRWAGTASDLTVEDVHDDLLALDAARFIVIDEDLEEVLIRTLVRNDNIWKQPKMMLAMEGDASEITSPRLQAALLAELARIDVAALSDEPSRTGGESTRAAVQGVIGRLGDAFGNPSLGVSDTPPDSPPDTHTDTRSDGLPEPQATPTGNPHAGGRAHSPAPTPAPTPTASGGGAAAPRPDPDADITANTIIGEWLDRCHKRPPKQVIGQMGKQIKDLLNQDVDPDDIRRGVAKWLVKGSHPATLPSFVNEVMNATSGRPGPGNGAMPSTTDQRVAAAQALKHRPPGDAAEQRHPLIVLMGELER